MSQPDLFVPPPRPPVERVRQLAELATAHDEWVDEHLADATFNPRDGGDYNLHYLDVDADPDAEDDFTARTAGLLGRQTEAAGHRPGGPLRAHEMLALARWAESTGIVDALGHIHAPHGPGGGRFVKKLTSSADDEAHTAGRAAHAAKDVPKPPKAPRMPRKVAPKKATPRERGSLHGLDAEALRDELDLRTIPELQAILGEKGLKKSGRKRDLVDRLVEHQHGGSKKDAPKIQPPEPPAAVPAPAPAADDEFAPRPSAPATPIRKSLQDAKTREDVAFEARIEARRITGRHIDFHFGGADVLTAREHAEGILRGLEHAPSAPLFRVATYGPGGTIDDDLVEGLDQADAVTLQRADRRGPIIAFNTRASGPGAVDHYHDHIVDRGYSGWSVPGARDGIYVGIHELGHAATPDKTAEKILAYADKAAGARGFEYTDELIGEEISQYASTDSQELAAEAFADVVLNGDMASPTSRRIYEMIVGRRRS